MNATAYRKDIQGLRAIAVVAVILFHVDKSWLPGGFVGVDIFFVISGFLITSIVLRHQSENAFSFASFYESRLRRILPAYLVLLVVVSLCMAILLVPRDFETYQRSLESALYFGSNSFFARHQDYFSPAGYELPLLHTWSLAVEMQFYLLLPMILVVVPRRHLGRILLLVGSLMLAYVSFRLTKGERQPIYFSLTARIPEFFIGSLLANRNFATASWTKVSPIAGCAGLLLVLASFFFLSEASNFPGLLALPSCVGTALIIAARSSIVNRALSVAPLVWLGAISYSLYLWHWPVLAGLRYFYGTYTLSALTVVFFAILTLVLSYASYRHIELPFRRKAVTPLRSRRPAVLLVTAVAGLLAALLLNPRLVPPLPDQLIRYSSASDICHGQMVGNCVRGDKTAHLGLLLLGDSHAAQLNHFADVVGRAIPAQIRVITASSCVTIPGFDVERIPEWARHPCLGQIEQAKHFIRSANSVLLAGKWEYQYSSKKFMSALEAFLADAQLRKQRVLVLAQIPMLSSNVQRAHRFEYLGLNANIVVGSEWHKANEAVRKLVARYRCSEFLDLTRARLFSRPPLDNRVLIYSDKEHLNEIGSLRYGEIAAPHLLRWLSRDHDSCSKGP